MAVAPREMTMPMRQRPCDEQYPEEHDEEYLRVVGRALEAHVAGTQETSRG